MNEAWVPIVMFTMIGLVLGFFYYFRYRARAEMQQTVRVALERGQELSPDLVERLGEPRRAPVADLRRGLVGLALALALGLFGVILGEEDAVRPLLATSMLPLFVGIAYLVMWRMNRSEERS